MFPEDEQAYTHTLHELLQIKDQLHKQTSKEHQLNNSSLSNLANNANTPTTDKLPVAHYAVRGLAGQPQGQPQRRPNTVGLRNSKPDTVTQTEDYAIQIQ